MTEKTAAAWIFIVDIAAECFLSNMREKTVEFNKLVSLTAIEADM